MACWDELTPAPNLTHTLSPPRRTRKLRTALSGHKPPAGRLQLNYQLEDIALRVVDT